MTRSRQEPPEPAASPKPSAARTSGTSFTIVSEKELRMERLFDAPVARLFKAYTDPRQIPQWWGPREQKTRVDVMEVRPGGKWRFVHTGADGSESAFRGIYREVVPNKRIVSTFEFEPWAGRISEDTATFTDEGGRTRLVATTRFADQADRDGMLDTGMEQGARETWDRLAELVEAPRSTAPGRNASRRRDEEEE
jgi:uncharacterized protein YndB with AHSA1/START domain